MTSPATSIVSPTRPIGSRARTSAAYSGVSRRSAVPGVYDDSQYGTTLAIEHLWNLGHRQIICVTDPSISDGRIRTTAYEQQMRVHWLTDDLQVFEVLRLLRFN
jgi:DNA-binding LacI/PurR family transcriptional regulator